MKRANWFMTEQQISDLDKLAVLSGLKKSELIRRAMDKYITAEFKRFEKKERTNAKRN